MLLAVGAARAADQTKANNSDALDLATSWVGNAVPGSGDRAIWDGTLSSANCTNTVTTVNNWGQIQVKSPSAGVPVYISGANVNSCWRRLIGVGGCALDMSAATVDLVIGPGFTIQSQSGTPYFTNTSGRTLTISGRLWLGDTANRQLTMDGGGNYVISGSTGGSAGGKLIKQGSGALTISIPNYACSNLVLNAGTLNLNHNYAINGNANSRLTINGGTIGNTSGGAIGLTANPPIYDWNGDFAFSGTANLNLGGGAVALSGNRQVTVNNNTLTVGGVIDDSGAGYSLTKVGAGTLNLAGMETYTGNTIVSGGTLILAQNVYGGQLLSPKILVGSGATLNISIRGWQGSGSQSLGGASTSGTGTVYGRDVVLNSGDGLSFEASGGGSPSVGQLNISHNAGSLHLNDNTVTIHVTGSPLGVSTNTLLTDAAAIYGNANPAPVFTGLALSNACGAAIITTSGAAGNIVLVVTNTPQTGETTTTTMARTAGASPEIYGGELDFTATVTGTATAPTGNVIFKDGGTILATVGLTPVDSTSSTAIYVEYTDLKVAGSPHSVAAYYEGDGTHNISDSSASPVSQTITAKQLTYSGITADSTIYDGNTAAKLGGAATLQTAEPPGTGSTSDGTPYTVDSVSAGGTATGVLAAKDVGDRAVTLSGVTLAGAGAGNYTLLQQAGLVQTVTAKALSVVGLGVTNKLADGTTTAGFTTNSLATLRGTEAPGTGTTSDGKPYTGDAVSLTGTPVGTFAQTNAADNIAVNVTGLSLTGADTDDYTLTEPALTASIIGPPGDQIRADNSGYTLQTGYAWRSGFQPDATNWAIWTGSYQSANLTDSLGGNVTWGGILISNVTGGPVVIQGNSTLALNTVTSGGGGVKVVGANDLTLDLARMNIAAGQSWNVASGSTFTWAANTSPYAFNLDNPSGSHNLALNGAGDYVFAGALYDNPGSAVVTINGPGTVTVSKPDYVKYWVLNGGTLNINQAYAVSGYGGSILTISGGTIDNTSGGAITVGNAPSCGWNGDFTFAGSADLNLGSGTVTLGGNRQVTVTSGTLTVGGAIGDGGYGYSLTKAGVGALHFFGANTYSGNTTVNGGSLVVAQAKLATNSTISVAVTAGALLQLDFAVTNTVARLLLDGAAQPAGVYGASSGTPGFAGAGSLLVMGSVAPTPTNITYTVSAGQMNLNWPAGQGWVLQSNSISVANPSAWHPVTGAAPPYPITISPAKAAVFYRLVYP